MVTLSNKVIGNNPSALAVCSCGTAHVMRLDLPIQLCVMLCSCGNLVTWYRSDKQLAAVLTSVVAAMEERNDR